MNHRTSMYIYIGTYMIYDAVNKKRNHIECELRRLFVRYVQNSVDECAIYAIATVQVMRSYIYAT